MTGSADHVDRSAPTRFKMLATDLDEPLRDRTGAIHERDRRAIAELRAAAWP